MSEPVEVRFTRIHADAKAPTRGSELAAGWDLRTVEQTTVHKGASIRVQTGLIVAIPAGFEGQVRARSSLAGKGLILPNAPGTIDADYRGEIKIIMGNFGDRDEVINHGDRVAQIVLAPVTQAGFEVVAELGSTERGAGGFGSTGRN